MKKIYLGGPIMDLSFEQASTWREEAKKLFYSHPNACFKFLDPMRRNFKDSELESRNEIVQLDKADIIEADILLVNATKPSWGTAMEIMFAYQHHKVILAFVGEDFSKKTLSPWLAYHTTRTFLSMEFAIEYIKKYF